MSKKKMSATTMKFLEDRKEIERKHLEYLRNVRRVHLEKRAAREARSSEVEYDALTDTYSIRDSVASIAGYDFTTGAAIYSTHGSAATYSLPPKGDMASMTSGYMPSWSGASAPTTDARIKYLTLEEAMKLHREEEERKYYHKLYETAPTVHPARAGMVYVGPAVHIHKSVRVAAMSDGTYPEVGMRVMHDGITFEIERIEIETPSWRAVAVGHAVGDMDTFVAGRLYVRAPLDELQPAKAKESVA